MMVSRPLKANFLIAEQKPVGSDVSYHREEKKEDVGNSRMAARAGI